MLSIVMILFLDVSNNHRYDNSEMGSCIILISRSVLS